MTAVPELPGLLAAYVADPGPDALAEVRRVAREAPGFRTDLAPGAVLGPLLGDEDYAGAISAGRAMMPGALLSPSVHLVLAEAHERLGDGPAAEREAALARAAIDGILRTGDGSATSPWSVLRLSDEYDVLLALGTTSTGQQVLAVGDRSLDRHDGADGSTYHFDVTGML